MSTQVNIPDDAGFLARSQAAAAGYDSVDAYLADLIRRQKSEGRGPSRIEAARKLKALRRSLPKLTTQEVLGAVRESRADLR